MNVVPFVACDDAHNRRVRLVLLGEADIRNLYYHVPLGIRCFLSKEVKDCGYAIIQNRADSDLFAVLKQLDLAYQEHLPEVSLGQIVQLAGNHHRPE
jgi:hypothetical protein